MRDRPRAWTVERAAYKGIESTGAAAVHIARDDRLYGFGMPADAGLYLACLMAPPADYPQFMADVGAGWDREASRLPLVGAPERFWGPRTGVREPVA